MTNAKVNAPKLGVLKIDLSECTPQELKKFIQSDRLKKLSKKVKKEKSSTTGE